MRRVTRSASQILSRPPPGRSRTREHAVGDEFEARVAIEAGQIDDVVDRVSAVESELIISVKPPGQAEGLLERHGRLLGSSWGSGSRRGLLGLRMSPGTPPVSRHGAISGQNSTGGDQLNQSCLWRNCGERSRPPPPRAPSKTFDSPLRSTRRSMGEALKALEVAKIECRGLRSADFMLATPHRFSAGGIVRAHRRDAHAACYRRRPRRGIRDSPASRNRPTRDVPCREIVRRSTLSRESSAARRFRANRRNSRPGTTTSRRRTTC